MDIGCYAVHIVRTLAGAEPEVLWAVSKKRRPGVDRWTRAELGFADGRTGQVTAGMWAGSVFRAYARVTGERAVMSVLNPLGPHPFNLLTVRGPSGTRRERVQGRPTYEYQLEAFVSAITQRDPLLTGPQDSVANMRIIDAIYRAAGLKPRPGSTGPDQRLG
jgi:predicted dehydrogenase